MIQLCHVCARAILLCVFCTHVCTSTCMCTFRALLSTTPELKYDSVVSCVCSCDSSVRAQFCACLIIGVLKYAGMFVFRPTHGTATALQLHGNYSCSNTLVCSCPYRWNALFWVDIDVVLLFIPINQMWDSRTQDVCVKCRCICRAYVWQSEGKYICVLQCVAVLCSVTHEIRRFVLSVGAYVGLMYDRVRASASVCCNVLQCDAVLQGDVTLFFLKRAHAYTHV